MSQSQQSDFASSIYSNEIDSLGHLPHSNLHCLTPEPSSSQLTFDSLYSDFRRPTLPPAVPPSLTRVGPGRNKAYVLYDEMSHNDWVEWWLQTDYGGRSNIRWDSTHQSAVWTHFNQVAHGTNGAPKVMCKHCGAILEHPSNLASKDESKRQRQGTSTMAKHVKSAACQRATKAPKAEITRFLQKTDHLVQLQFSQEAWEKEILQYITITRLPFHHIEHPKFLSLVQMAQSAPSPPLVPSASTIRRRLQSAVKEQQQDILRKLPSNAKISIALDCWTSPFSQAFIAITGYFIDADWVYHEVLLGFKPLHGMHSGVNLSVIVLDTLKEHGVQDRVFGLTTDNASNNKTLADALQQAFPDGTHIIRIPCLAHVIQLSLNELLGSLKAVPRNETPETRWTDEKSLLARANAQSHKRNIATTLNKVRYLAIYVNASPQRRDAFYNLQTTETKLVPIQDIKTRWNSTFLMLRRAKRLRPIFSPFCTEYDREDLLLDNEEWRQIDYLLCITEPFFIYTTQLSKTRDITAHYMFKIYNKLFEHFEQSIKQLRQKRTPWKKQMLEALEAGRLKLGEYYSQTDNVRGHIYAVITMLAPANKFQFFLSKDWDKKWRDIYRKAIEDAVAPYKERLANDNISDISPISSSRPISRLDEMLDGSDYRPSIGTDELKQYLDSDVVKMAPLSFWKENQYRFPSLAALARDILSIPATGAGVERLFNTARDICHYRRGRLNSNTIQELMMYLCTSRFDLEDEQLALLEEFFSHEEIEAAKEEKDDKANEIELDPISDGEEEDAQLEIDRDLVETTEPPLSLSHTQLRISGRKRKSREDDEFEYH